MRPERIVRVEVEDVGERAYVLACVEQASVGLPVELAIDDELPPALTIRPEPGNPEAFELVTPKGTTVAGHGVLVFAIQTVMLP